MEKDSGDTAEQGKFFYPFNCWIIALRPVVPGGAGGDMAPQILADQLTLHISTKK